MQRENRRLAATIAADIAGYFRPIGRDEEAPVHALRGHRKALIDRSIGEQGGRIANAARPRRTADRGLGRATDIGAKMLFDGKLTIVAGGDSDLERWVKGMRRMRAITEAEAEQ